MSTLKTLEEENSTLKEKLEKAKIITSRLIEKNALAVDKIKEYESKNMNLIEKNALAVDKIKEYESTFEKFKKCTDSQNINYFKLVGLNHEVVDWLSQRQEAEKKWIESIAFQLANIEEKTDETKCEDLNMDHIDNEPTTNLDKSIDLDAFKTEVAMLSSIIQRRTAK